MEIKINRCDRTGLLYVNEVPFTQERIKMVTDVMSYSGANNKQFEYSLTITDTAHDTDNVVVIDKTNYEDFLKGIAKYKMSSISSDKDWK